MNNTLQLIELLFFELCKKAATELPEDVVGALAEAKEKETDIKAIFALKKILKNTELARDISVPICQDTGILKMEVDLPRTFSQKRITEIIKQVVDQATENIPLRRNNYNCFTEQCLGNIPEICFTESDQTKIGLMLCGGGCANLSGTYALPLHELRAGRNLEGVEKCVLDVIYRAQGKGCPPYIIGIAISGSHETAARMARLQLYRNLDDQNSSPELNDFEQKLLEKINNLGIGPMGMGGKTTALAVKIDNRGIRIAASYIVGIYVSCWCLRRCAA